MEILSFLLALACSLVAYFIEKNMWMTLVRTTDKTVYKEWCYYLEDNDIPYHVKKVIVFDDEQWHTVYKVKVHVREVAKVNATN